MGDANPNLNPQVEKVLGLELPEFNTWLAEQVENLSRESAATTQSLGEVLNLVQEYSMTKFPDFRASTLQLSENPIEMVRYWTLKQRLTQLEQIALQEQ